MHFRKEHLQHIVLEFDGKEMKTQSCCEYRDTQKSFVNLVFSVANEVWENLIPFSLLITWLIDPLLRANFDTKRTRACFYCSIFKWPIILVLSTESSESEWYKIKHQLWVYTCVRTN